MALLSAFDNQCRRTPDALALIDGERHITFGQLRQQALQLADQLLSHIGYSRRVIIALDRGIDAVIAIFATLGTGACYVPLDLKNPDLRLGALVEDADPQCVIGIGSCPNWLKNPKLWVNIQKTDRHAKLSDWPRCSFDDESLAAILYTSGSTGFPKGVALSHRALTNFADWAAQTFAIDSNDRIASLAPFHFDLSVFDLFSGLRNGATLYFVPSHLTRMPSRLTNWLAGQRITVFYTVPSLLGFISLKGSLTHTSLPNLRTILFAGDVFPTIQLRRLCEQLPQVEFFNLFGPTETNVCCYWPVDRARLIDNTPIPIGKPACGATLKIAEQNNELLVKSPNNLSGYWQHGKLSPALSEGQFFPTGDKVSRNEDGEYLYNGRLDRMLKSSGYRIEPAEIEAAILQHPDVISCAVVGLKDETAGRRPVAFIVLQSGATLKPPLIHSIKQQLPGYMHPSQFVVKESLPLLTNGKIDYQALSALMEQN